MTDEADSSKGATCCNVSAAGMSTGSPSARKNLVTSSILCCRDSLSSPQGPEHGGELVQLHAGVLSQLQRPKAALRHARGLCQLGLGHAFTFSYGSFRI